MTQAAANPSLEFSDPNDDRCQSVDVFAVVDGEANGRAARFIKY
jgi:hypothetical protein